MRGTGAGGMVVDEFSKTVQRLSASLPPAVARVAAFLDQNRAQAMVSSAAQLAAQLETSDATVIRAVQALGFGGLPDLKRALAASHGEATTPAANMRRTLAEIGSSTVVALESVLGAHREGMDALGSKAGQAGLVAAVKVLHPAGRIGIFGIGPSAHLARYVASLLVRSGRRSFTLDATCWALADQLLDLRGGDAIIMLAYGQPYREAQAVMGEATRLGMPVVLVTDTEASALARQATAVMLARRGRTAQVALHATTLSALEAVVLGLTAADHDQALGQLAHLDRLRKLVSTPAPPKKNRKKQN